MKSREKKNNVWSIVFFLPLLNKSIIIKFMAINKWPIGCGSLGLFIKFCVFFLLLENTTRSLTIKILELFTRVVYAYYFYLLVRGARFIFNIIAFVCNNIIRNVCVVYANRIQIYCFPAIYGYMNQIHKHCSSPW